MEKYTDLAILNQALNDYNHVSDKFITLIKCKKKSPLKTKDEFD